MLIENDNNSKSNSFNNLLSIRKIKNKNKEDDDDDNDDDDDECSIQSIPLSAGFSLNMPSIIDRINESDYVKTKKDTEDGEIDEEVEQIMRQSDQNNHHNNKKMKISEEDIEINQVELKSAKLDLLDFSNDSKSIQANPNDEMMMYDTIDFNSDLKPPKVDPSTLFNFSNHHQQIQANHVTTSSSSSVDQIQYVDGRPRLIVSIELDLLNLVNMNQLSQAIASNGNVTMNDDLKNYLFNEKLNNNKKQTELTSLQEQEFNDVDLKQSKMKQSSSSIVKQQQQQTKTRLDKEKGI
jgi:hypothetical protein